MLRLNFFETNREESERVMELKNVTGTGRLPYGTLALGAEGIKKGIYKRIMKYIWTYVSIYKIWLTIIIYFLISTV